MTTKANRNNLTTGVIWKRLLVFFLPIAAGTCIQQLYNAFDGMIVGKYVGTVALAAVGGSTANIINVLIGFFVSVTSGAAVVLAQIYGAGREDDISQASANALAVSAVTGLVLTVVGILSAPVLLRLLQTPEDTIPDSLTYLRIYYIGVPFILVLNMESNLLRSVGDSYHPFLYMLVGCVSNIILDVIFVLPFGWGVAGAAIATVIAQVINMTLLTVRLLRTRESYRLDLHQLRLKGRFLSGMLHIGIPAGLQSSMYSVSNLIIQVGVNSLGTVVVASWAMTSKVDGIYWAIISALGTAITTFIGQNVGAGKTDRVSGCVKQGMVLSVLITLVLSSTLLAAGKWVLRILTDDPNVIDTTYRIMWYFVPFYITWTLIEVLSGVLRGVGDAVNPVIIIGLGICLFRIVWIVTVFAWVHTLLILSLSYVASWVVTGIALLIYYRRGSWKRRAEKLLIDK